MQGITKSSVSAAGRPPNPRGDGHGSPTCAAHPCPQPPAGVDPCAQSSAVQSPCWGAAHVAQRARAGCSPVEAPSARALAMCPTVWIPPSAITGTPNLLAYSDTLYTAVAWGRPHASTTGGERAARGVRCRAAARPHPSRPFRLAAHTCSSTQERTNPQRLLPQAAVQEKPMPGRCLLGRPRSPQLQGLW